MAIMARVIQQGRVISAYDRKGTLIWSLPIATGVSLESYTGTTVTVRQGNMIDIYDQRGVLITSRPV
jgi:hypothetical protein